MIVVVKLDALALVIPRVAVGAVPRPVFATPEIIFRSLFDVVGDDKVQPAVLVVIKPSCTGRPCPSSPTPGLCGDVGKRPVAVVVVEDGAAMAGDIQIGESIIVNITHRNALAVMAFSTDASFLAHVGEGSVTVIVVERASQGVRRFVSVGRGRLNEEKVHESVLVAVDPADARAHGFEIILFFGLRGILREGGLGAFTDVGVADRDAGFGRRRPRAAKTVVWLPERSEIPSTRIAPQLTPSAKLPLPEELLRPVIDYDPQ